MKKTLSLNGLVYKISYGIVEDEEDITSFIKNSKFERSHFFLSYEMSNISFVDEENNVIESTNEEIRNECSYLTEFVDEDYCGRVVRTIIIEKGLIGHVVIELKNNDKFNPSKLKLIYDKDIDTNNKYLVDLKYDEISLEIDVHKSNVKFLDFSHVVFEKDDDFIVCNF